MPRLLRELLALPTAPFLEGEVLSYLETFCRRLPGVVLSRDPCGNLLARYRKGSPATGPVAFTAHMDHPGFAALEMRAGRKLRAAFRGWVEPEYFPDAPVRFWTGQKWIRGTVLEVTRTAKLPRASGRKARPEEVLITVEQAVAPDSPGMWDLPEPELRRGCVYARACDDLAGCAALAALLVRLARAQAEADVYCLFTRAEEVGFVGAIGAARAGTIPKDVPVVAIETSKALPHAPVGEGPILRVGDRVSVFSSGATAFCQRVAAGLAERKRNFAFQRRLMDGGTCESTAYSVYGYETTGICVALGNYHNMDTRRRRIASEYVSLRDWMRMVDWFEALARDQRGVAAERASLRAGIDERFENYLPLLAKIAPAAAALAGTAGSHPGSSGAAAAGAGVR
jgi:endoglucanase